MGARGEPPNEKEMVTFALGTLLALPGAWLFARKTWRRPWAQETVERDVGEGAYRAAKVVDQRELPVPLAVKVGAFVSFVLSATIPLVGYPFLFELHEHLTEPAGHPPLPTWFTVVYFCGLVAIPITFVTGLVLRAHLGRQYAKVVAALAAAASVTTLCLVPHTMALRYAGYHVVLMSWLALLFVAWTISLAGSARALGRRPTERIRIATTHAAKSEETDDEEEEPERENERRNTP